MDNYCWQWLTRDRLDLSSERAPHRDKTANFKQNIWSQAPQLGRHEDVLTDWPDWPSVVTWLQLTTNTKLTHHNALISSAMTYAWPPGNSLQKHIYSNCRACETGFSAHWQFSKAHVDSWYARSFPSSLRLRLHNKIMQEAKIMKIKMSAILDKAKPHTENIRGLDLAAVTCTTVPKCLDWSGSVNYY
jgi:hypothetical protein